MEVYPDNLLQKYREKLKTAKYVALENPINSYYHLAQFYAGDSIKNQFQFRAYSRVIN